jgi:hypothetical protein
MRVEFKLNRIRPFAGAAVASAMFAFLLFGTAGGQPVALIENFLVQLENYPPPNETQVKTQLEGAKAEQLPGGLFLITDGKLKNFSTNGVLIMLVETPQCVFDMTRRTVSSSAPLRASSTDGNFFLEGQGFILTQSNSVLSITNRVRTVIRNLPGHRSFKP